MAKPRIIIADKDINYIIPLQLKFIEDFFDKADLEIITDEDYFNELFSTPQRADILIISEDLYNSSLQRHNIANIFLMTEQYEEEQTAELNINKIFKYTSIKEIFNEIIGKSADQLKIKTAGKKEPEIIMVYSASGGTGKTTVALGICGCLTKNYKRVLYINASLLQSFQCNFENSTPVSTSDIYAKLTNPGDNLYNEIKHTIRKELFNYIPPFKAALLSLGLKYSVFEKIAISAKRSGEYDYIVVDADSSFNEDNARLINASDKVIIVTQQDFSSVYATNNLVSNINGINGEKYFFICNNFDKNEDNALISPLITMKFGVSEYVEHIKHYEKIKIDDLTRESGIQKVAFLIM